MNRNGTATTTLDLRCFDENRRNQTAENLAAFVGQFVAWSLDGTRILAFGPTREAVDERLAAIGIDFSHVVHDYIDPPLG